MNKWDITANIRGFHSQIIHQVILESIKEN